MNENVSGPNSPAVTSPAIEDLFVAKIIVCFESLMGFFALMTSSGEWKDVTSYSPKLLIDGTTSDAGEALMRRRDGAAWQYRRQTEDEALEIMSRDAW
ncbi:hypothetical protein [Methylobacterium sp. V23]|uniref:hypothetical protein n=1 Tax=Methylobacterium sp. V23 TaxID=2044878 RepID=UPI000CDA0D5D|nr:hypothetical protein [Methylobacterium sp. V23]POR44581.1 hypothetical protein CRT23_01030 [Methylobacterium sp. V23]